MDDKLHPYRAFFDKKRFQFTDRKPIRQGAIDLRNFKVGKDYIRLPTSKDIEKLKKKTF